MKDTCFSHRHHYSRCCWLCIAGQVGRPQWALDILPRHSQPPCRSELARPSPHPSPLKRRLPNCDTPINPLALVMESRSTLSLSPSKEGGGDRSEGPGGGERALSMDIALK